MAEHLLEKGYKRFAYIGSNLQLDTRAKKRKQGFESAINDSGATIINELTPKDASSMMLGRQLTAELLSQNHQIDAIYYSNDDMAAGGLMHCLATGLKPPRDIALASFNGLEFIDALPLKITTIKSPRFEIGRLAADYIANEASESLPKATNELIFTLEEGDTT